MLKPFLKQLGLFALLIAVAGGILFFTRNIEVEKEVAQSPNEIRRVQIGDSVFNVELADSPAERQQGLSGHKPLRDDEGMLFIFEKSDTYGFWMKDMLFALDIIWLGENQRIVYIAKDLAPATYPQVFTPSSSALYVLEINTGLSDKNNLKVGDKIELLK